MRRSVLMVLVSGVCFSAVVYSAGANSQGQARAGGACSSSQCVGLDPVAEACNGAAETLFSQDYTYRTAAWHVDIRYSPDCNAGWVRQTPYLGSGGAGFALSAWNPGAPSVGVTRSTRSGRTVWTTMVDGSGGLQICAGTQLYWNGRWVKWLFYGCVVGSSAGGSGGDNGGGNGNGGGDNGGGSGNGGGGGQSPSVTLSQGPAVSAGIYRYAISLSGFAANTTIGVTCYDSVDPGGFYNFNLSTDSAGAASTASYCYSGDGPDHWVIAGATESNHVAWGEGSNSGGSNPPPPQTYSETETYRHPVNTFADYSNASGLGQQIGAGVTVQVSCKILAPTIDSVSPDGYWYRIASDPWDNAYYSPANTFLNGDPPDGPYSHNTDFSVPDC